MSAAFEDRSQGSLGERLEAHRDQLLRSATAATLDCNDIAACTFAESEKLIGEAAREIERALSALSGLRAFFNQPDEGPVEAFERLAEVFHRETGYLRPGKDCPTRSFEEREGIWKEWVKAKLAAADAVLPQANEVSGTSNKEAL